MKLSRNLIIAIFSLLVLTVASVTVVMVVYFNSYIITYDLDGGEMDENETRVWVGSEYSLPTPTKAGYAFAGWYLKDQYFLSEGIWEIEDDVTLTAKWGLRDDIGVIYNKGDDGYIIESFNGSVSSNIVLPMKYNGEAVVGIKAGALDVLNDRVKDVAQGFIKVYLPSNIAVDRELSLGESIFVCRYNAVDNKGFIYLEEESGVSVVGYNGAYTSDIVIPEIYNGKPVTAVGDYGFYGTEKYLIGETDDFYRILMPECIKAVGKNAFGLCNGIKASLYNTKNGKLLEIIDLSRLFDWLTVVSVSKGNDDLVKVVTQIMPAFGWSEHTSANYYVRYNTNGGEILKKMTIVNKKGENETVTVNVKDATLKKNKSYTLPTPTREGYTFAGWYYGEKLVPVKGTSWGFDNHVEITAKWIAIQKEG